MFFIRAVVVALALALVGPVAAVAVAPAALDPVPLKGRLVELSPDDVSRLGIRAVPLAAAHYTPRVHGYGVVMDLNALAQADADVMTAQAAARQSHADVVRSRALFAQGQAISRQALDAAEKQAATDEAALLLAQRQEIVQFGPKLPWRGDHADVSILKDLTSGHLVLVRATFPLDAMAAALPPEITVTHLSAQQDPAGWASKRLWAAPADPTIPGRSFFALVARSDLQAGEHVLVNAPVGPTLTGVQIPSAAVLLSEEKTWCYLQFAPGTFQRVRLDLSRPLSGGYFVKVSPGASVVVRGAGLLLARELGAAALRY